MKSKNFIVTSIFTVLLTFMFIVLLPTFISKANSLTAAYLYLSRIQANVNGSSATVEYVFAIDASQAFSSGGTVTISFPNADDGYWCRTAGALTVTSITASSADLAATNWAIDATLPNSGTALAASCTKGIDTSTVDKIVISNVGALAAGTTYGVKLTNGSSAGVIGTGNTAGEHDVTVEVKNGSVIDSSTFGIYLISNDTVVVSATVSATPSVTCSISSNAVNLGSLYPGGSYSTTTHTISTTTSATTDGYYWAAYGTGDGSTDAGLWKSTATTYLIASTGSGTINLTGVGAEGFGMTLSDPDAAGSAVVSSDFSDATSGTFGALDRGTAGAQLILYQNGAQTTGESSTVTYGARAGASAQAGAYTESVIFVCGGYY